MVDPNRIAALQAAQADRLAGDTAADIAKRADEYLAFLSPNPAPVVIDLDQRFDHHPPSSDTVAQTHEDVRSVCKQAAAFIAQKVPYGREHSLALTALEEAMFWANAGIARHQGASQ